MTESITAEIALLLEAVERHAALEVEALSLCERLAQARGDPVIALVMRLIREDEERHLGLLQRISARLRTAVEWTSSLEPVPHLVGPVAAPATAEYLASLVRSLIDEEGMGAQALRHLAQAEPEVIGGLDRALLEMMAIDSDKHARLLHFVWGRLEARAHPLPE
jgi:hypothetical protein